MSDYKIAICDDTEADRNYIKDLVTRWAHSSNQQIDIHLFSSAEEFLFEYEEDKGYQILLLDIEMGKMDVRGNYTTIHADKEITVKKTMSEIEKELDERLFRVGRSSLVNLSCISRVTKTDIFFNNGESVPLPRGSYEKVNRAIIDFG